MPRENKISETQIIAVPFDSGRKNVGMGAGPRRLVESGVGSLPGALLDQVEVEELPFELGTTLRVLNVLSEKVALALQSGRFPLVLAGGCVSCLGTLAGLGGESTAVVWLDAHGDFNTPETTISGYLDGMALAMATGRCWQNLTRLVRGYRPVHEENVILVGARDLDGEERRLLERSAVTWIDIATLRRQGIERSLSQSLGSLRADQIYLHVDLDVLDAGEARVNRFSSTGGLTLAELLETVRTVASGRPVAAAAITAYDPLYDTDGKALRAAAALTEELVAINHHSFVRAPMSTG